MKKSAISKFFLYRHRFALGYSLLLLAFVALIFGLPLLSPAGLSQAEMESATHSYNLHLSSIFTGDLVDLPYRILQKLSIMTLGLTIYSVKLPSMIIGLMLGLLLVLLLNRWFKNNVALLASILAVLSSSFLYLAGSGTPLIMLVFWPTLLLWLGSKIQGVTKPKPLYCFIFAFALLASIFTPHLIYLAIFIVLFAFLHPHLRFTIKTLPIIPLVITTFIILAGGAALVMAVLINPPIASELLLAPDFSFDHFLTNLQIAFLPFFSWNTTLESTFLSPFVGLASVALAVIGLLSTTKGFFASRNSIATCLIIFTIILSGLNPESAILILLPLAILIAHGLRYILDKWYDLFPENPYARITALIPISIFLGIMIYGDISHFIFGNRYSPMVADQYNDDITLIHEKVPENSTIYIIDDPVAFNFYQILEEEGSYIIEDLIPNRIDLPINFATLGPTDGFENNINQIITSSKSNYSDRIYMYTVERQIDDSAINEDFNEETTEE